MLSASISASIQPSRVRFSDTKLTHNDAKFGTVFVSCNFCSVKEFYPEHSKVGCGIEKSSSCNWLF